MQVDKFWKIEADSFNVILFKKVKRTRKADKTKYEDWEHVGYYSTPTNALHGMVEHRIKATCLKDMETITKELDKLHSAIDSLPKTFRAVPWAVSS